MLPIIHKKYFMRIKISVNSDKKLSYLVESVCDGKYLQYGIGFVPENVLQILTNMVSIDV